LIFITDDHPDSAEYLARLLRKVGYATAVFPSGATLLARLAETRPALIVLDVMMPEMTGIECLRHIRNDPALADIPVIMYSADFSFERNQEAAKAGAQEFLVKGTVLWPDFLKTVQKYAAPEARPSTAPTPPLPA
jgi:CheY-like chemotaxis protein